MKAAEDNLLKLLSDLVSFPTESRDTAANSDCFDYLERFLSQRHMRVSRYSSNSYPSLVATSRHTQKPKLMLQAHMDVVPAKPTAYKLSESQGKLLGRGVYDMKFAAACFLQLVEELRDELSDYDFGIMLTSDEEIGGSNGVGFLLKEKGYDAEACVLPDGGCDWGIQTGGKGVWFIKLTAFGRNAHGSKPWEGENAIDKLMDVLPEIKSLFENPGESESTISVSRLKAGEAINQVPDKAVATIDMRLVSEEDYQVKRAAIEKIAAHHELEIETIEVDPPEVTDLDNSYVARFIELAEEIGGKPLGRIQACGATDGRYFEAKGIPTIIMRPGGGCAHADNEWLDKEEFIKFYELIKAYVLKTAKVK